mmetsp:Transcript_12070/g.36796  ORF Transcript_12070/g.36796 Transcript_12070/m.36796 type:complete len:619 (+) Transcript_12070:228-2084(+)
MSATDGKKSDGHQRKSHWKGHGKSGGGGHGGEQWRLKVAGGHSKENDEAQSRREDHDHSKDEKQLHAPGSAESTERDSQAKKHGHGRGDEKTWNRGRRGRNSRRDDNAGGTGTRKALEEKVNTLQSENSALQKLLAECRSELSQVKSELEKLKRQPQSDQPEVQVSGAHLDEEKPTEDVGKKEPAREATREDKPQLSSEQAPAVEDVAAKGESAEPSDAHDGDGEAKDLESLKIDDDGDSEGDWADMETDEDALARIESAQEHEVADQEAHEEHGKSEATPHQPGDHRPVFRTGSGGAPRGDAGRGFHSPPARRGDLRELLNQRQNHGNDNVRGDPGRRLELRTRRPEIFTRDRSAGHSQSSHVRANMGTHGEGNTHVSSAGGGGIMARSPKTGPTRSPKSSFAHTPNRTQVPPAAALPTAEELTRLAEVTADWWLYRCNLGASQAVLGQTLGVSEPVVVEAQAFRWCKLSNVANDLSPLLELVEKRPEKQLWTALGEAVQLVLKENKQDYLFVLRRTAAIVPVPGARDAPQASDARVNVSYFVQCAEGALEYRSKSVEQEKAEGEAKKEAPKADGENDDDSGAGSRTSKFVIVLEGWPTNRDFGGMCRTRRVRLSSV